MLFLTRGAGKGARTDIATVTDITTGTIVDAIIDTTADIPARPNEATGTIAAGRVSREIRRGISSHRYVEH
jgi:hypothetical protein